MNALITMILLAEKELERQQQAHSVRWEDPQDEKVVSQSRRVHLRWTFLWKRPKQTCECS